MDKRVSVWYFALKMFSLHIDMIMEISVRNIHFHYWLFFLCKCVQLPWSVKKIRHVYVYKQTIAPIYTHCIINDCRIDVARDRLCFALVRHVHVGNTGLYFTVIEFLTKIRLLECGDFGCCQNKSFSLFSRYTILSFQMSTLLKYSYMQVST